MAHLGRRTSETCRMHLKQSTPLRPARRSVMFFAQCPSALLPFCANCRSALLHFALRARCCGKFLPNPSLILPTDLRIPSGRPSWCTCGASWARLGRVLAENIAFQHAFQKRSNFDTVSVSLVFDLESLFTSWLPESIKIHSKNHPKMYSILVSIID